jgi:hypothetical protein
MRHCQHRLPQNETLIGLDQVHAPAQNLAGHHEMVCLGIVTAQRKLESTLACQSAMASAGVAPDFRHHGDDLVDEIRYFGAAMTT